MKLHTVFITHNRLELTKRAIESYLETVSVPFVIWVVDNASTDGTQEWLQEWSRQWDPDINKGITLLRENRYPGAACNEGWQMSEIAHWGSGDEPTHLQRADNDFEFLPGWCDEVKKRFRYPKLGQLGMRTNEEELNNWNNVGGNCIIRRVLWDMGLRYDERPWPQIREEVGKGWSEDGLFSPAVKKMGFAWSRVKVPCIRPLANSDVSDPYYAKSFGDRGIVT